LVKHLAPEFAYLEHEELHVLCLNRRGAIIMHLRFVATGLGEHDFKRIVNGVFDVKKTVAFVLAHNHVQGSPVPNTGEKQFRSRLVRTLRNGGVLLRDHIVFGGSRVWSHKANRTLSHRDGDLVI
jgi:DNA repair protein RadC